MPGAHHHKRSRWPQILVIGGIALLIVGMLVYKNSTAGTTQASGLPEEQLHRALAAGEPSVVFFHSLTCDPCIAMMNTVDEVYPEFAGSITLIDVNVSDTRNHDLLRDQGIQAIPSLVFYDGSGQSETSYGVIPPETLRQRLQHLLEGQS